MPGRTTSEGSAASSTAGAHSSRPAWCVPSPGPRAPRPTSTSSVSAQPGLQPGATLLCHGCSFQYAPGRWAWHRGCPPASPGLALQLWALHLHPSLCRGCFPPAHPRPPEPPCLRPLHGLQVSRALASPCVGQSSPPSPSPVMPHGEPLVGRRTGPAPSWQRKGHRPFHCFSCCWFTSPSAKPSTQPAVPQAGLAVPMVSCHPLGAVHNSGADREQRGLRVQACIRLVPMEQ